MSLFWKREKAEKQDVSEQGEKEIRLVDTVEKDAEEKTIVMENNETEKTMSMEEYQRIYGDKKQKTEAHITEVNDSHKYMDPVEIVLAEQEKRLEEKDGLTLTRVPVVKKESAFLEPVGWLICTAGPDFGKSFPLKKGKNHIGRSAEMEVTLDDLSISRKEHAWIEYKEDKRNFYVCVGEARNLVYLNEDLLMMPAEMKKNDVLELGDSCLMLIPCCDQLFSWEDARG